MPDFLLPDLGEGLEEAEVISWHVAVGDDVVVDQIVVEVETAKAAVEVPVPFAGTVSALHAAPGASLKVGQPLITVQAGSKTSSPDGFREPGVAVPDPAPGAAEPEEGSGSVLIGYGTNTTPARRRRPGRGRRSTGRPDSARPAPAQPASSSLATASPAGPAAKATRPAVAVVSPIVRRLARNGGLDLGAMVGTGPCGVIRRQDVEQALQSQQTSPTAADAKDRVAIDDRGEDEVTRIPLRGVRRAIADKLSTSRREIPEATVWVDVDATELLAARAAMNARSDEQPVSLIALLARFTVLALRRYPELNARVEHDEIVVPQHVHLGFAAQTDRGLVVPVVHDAHRMTTRDLSAALAARTAAARGGQLAPTDLTGGTITVNNYGVFGVDGSAAIINHPEVAIIGMGRIIDRPWVVDGELTIRKISQLTLAFDHRACDGGTSGGFLRYIADCIENPISALADL